MHVCRPNFIRSIICRVKFYTRAHRMNWIFAHFAFVRCTSKCAAVDFFYCWLPSTVISTMKFNETFSSLDNLNCHIYWSFEYDLSFWNLFLKNLTLSTKVSIGKYWMHYWIAEKHAVLNLESKFQHRNPIWIELKAQQNQ